MKNKTQLLAVYTLLFFVTASINLKAQGFAGEDCYAYTQNLEYTVNNSLGIRGAAADLLSHLRRFQIDNDNNLITKVGFAYYLTFPGEILTVNIYSIDNSATLDYSNMTLLGSASHTTNTMDMNFTYMELGIIALVPINQDFVIEIVETASPLFKVGYNDTNRAPFTTPNQTGLSYTSFNQGLISINSFPTIAVILEACGQSSNPIPTMGEWGLCILTLLLCILAVTTIKQKQLAFT